MPRSVSFFLLGALHFALPFSSSDAQERVIQFEHIGLEQRLPQGQILGLLQDSYGFIWFGTMSGLIRYDGYSFVQYRHIPSDTGTLTHSTAWPAIEDNKGNIWIGSNKGLNRWDRVTNRFQRFYYDPDNLNGLPDNHVETVYQDKSGQLWIGTFRGAAWYDGKLFHRIPLSFPGSNPGDIHVFSILEDKTGNILMGTNQGMAKIDPFQRTGRILSINPERSPAPQLGVRKLYRDRESRIWAGTDNGLFLWNEESETFARIPLKGTPEQQAVRSIIQDNRGFFWISTLNDNGMFRLNPATGKVEHFRHAASNSFSLSSDHVRDFLTDKLNNLWIGTYNGLNKLDLNTPRFAFLQQEPGLNQPENLIYTAYADRWGGLWFSTYKQKSFYAKKAETRAAEINFLPYKVFPTQLEKYCSTSDGDLWIATWPNGLIRYNVETGRATALGGLTDSGDSLELLGYFFMEEDNSNSDCIWVSSRKGLCKLHKKTLRRTCFPPKKDIPDLKTNEIWNALQAPGNVIYVLFESHFNGRLGRFDKRTGKYALIDVSRAFPEGKNTIHVRQFAYTPDGTIWMATASGLGKYDPASGVFTLLTTRDGLAEDILMGIATDARGNVWFKSLRYLSKYHPRTGAFWHFNVTRDMKEFNTVGATVGKDGRMFFFGNNGFYAFYPDSVYLDSTLPKVVLTDFKVLNQSRHFGTAPELIRNITLGYRDNVFSFEYAALHFRDPGYNRYRYRLEGFDGDWVEAGAERKVTYTNLDAGRYTFRVMACNADGIWNTEPLSIELRLLPAPWRSWWAYCLYALLLGGTLYTFYRFQLRRRLAEAETGRLKELDTVKTKLYTNITHEFRTPLTVILGMVSQIRTSPKTWLDEGLDMIERNGKNLLRLVNQMLDLSKLEAGAMPVHLIRGDIVPFLKYQLESFHSLAESKGIRLEFQAEQEAFVVDYDPEKIETIVSNLLSNAVKFTSKGMVQMCVCRNNDSEQRDKFIIPHFSFIIRIKDTGPGIPPEKLPHIFERFYQAEDAANRTAEGTGIGLAVTKELIKLLEGEISVKSESGVGTEFTVKLPLTRNAPLAPQKASKEATVHIVPIENKNPEPFGQAEPAQAPVLLIVEDNNDVVIYLKSLLQNSYHIEVAGDGHTGLAKALETVPDIILSDVMMPGIDGFELCKTLKTDIRTSHIPIILLTAKANMGSKIEGLQHGADAYLSKPFEKAELFVRLEKLVELRKRLQERYSNAGADITPHAPTSLEDAFMQQVRSILEAHLGDENYGIPGLCKALGMSRAQLYRKFQALTDQPVGHYFRSLRLLKAKALLQTTDLHISEIAFEVGFKNPAHFTRAFSEEFGGSPREWRKGL